ncbi:SMP-30/gluconolactonase/LRE family protein [Falsiroseomonas sp.]|uniref:SMP-30/gluconolactonase/LRE family protein n=1 Tax=Falsiroseomonas sp. TaxID=2870721 RepID=UPI002726DD95|nr:SMP-30/gluconolactonase/LRE family protein [Falsiroseomonas sp.]MDO9500550.1 SMP-30/gluconolactonase/LRE family protein [Falsiroseomonas sp.]MDP3415482.1 SMP-30/gluconolactonase/LRE family protein [Falsiroseomonas sp.]
MVPLMQMQDVSFHGSGLVRPECVLVAPDGAVFAADFRGGVAALAADGSHRLIRGETADLPEGLKPNGIAFEPDGAFILAHLGNAEGGVFRLARDGQVTPLLREVDGVALPPTNYAVRDIAGRLWATVSTRLSPRHLDWTPRACTGFIVVQDDRGSRIVADGLGYTNECMPSPDGRFLYVNETYTQRLSRFPLAADGTLGPKQVVAEFGPGEYPDGLAFDEEGQVWVTAIVANRLLRVDPATGGVTRHLDAGVPEHIERIARGSAAGTLVPQDMAEAGGSPLANVSSLAFAGPGRREAWLGCLLADRIMRTPIPFAGHPPPHWGWRLRAD